MCPVQPASCIVSTAELNLVTETTTELAQRLLAAVQAKLPSCDLAGLAPDLAGALRRREAADHETAARRAVLMARVAACVQAGLQGAVRLVTDATALCEPAAAEAFRLVPCSTARTSQRQRQRPRDLRVRFGLTRPERAAR